MSNTLQPIELTDSDLDVVSGGTYYKKYIKNSFNQVITSANGGNVTNGAVTAGGDVNQGNGGDASVHIG
jgi:hypothetical protein